MVEKEKATVEVVIRATIRVPWKAGITRGGGGPFVDRDEVHHSINSIIPSGWKHEVLEMDVVEDA